MPTDFSRYHRQMLLAGLGQEAQKRLAESTVWIVGCGGLGSAIASLLARAGVGHLVLLDRDCVDLTDLHRQLLFDEDDVARALPKVQAAERKLRQINSQVRITAIVDDLNAANAESYLQTIRRNSSCDAILDGLDNFETRLILNDLAVKYSIPYVYGGAVGTIGTSYTILPPTPTSDSPWEKQGRLTPCLRCLMDQIPPPGSSPTCSAVGVLGPLVSLIASLQCTETLKILTGQWQAIRSTLLFVDLWSNTFREFSLSLPDAAHPCPCCQNRQFEFLEGRLQPLTTVLCDAVHLAPQTRQKPDLARLAEHLKTYGQVQLNPFSLRIQLTEQNEDYQLTVFSDGRAIIKGTTDPVLARNLYAKYIGT